MHLMLVAGRRDGRPFDFVVGALSLRDSFSLPAVLVAAAHPPELTPGISSAPLL
jgi:hypothetical protein